MGVSNLRYGALCPLYAPERKIFYTRGEYVTMSNGIFNFNFLALLLFNFNFLALLLSEILGGSQIYTRGSYAPWTPPSGEIFVPKASTLQYLIVFLLSTFEALVVSKILGGPKFTLGCLCPPVRPRAEFF